MSEVRDDQVVINGTTYTLSSLRIKHLKEISKMIASPGSGGLIDKLSSWSKFMDFSIRQNQPNFDAALLDELTLTEMLDLWTKVQNLSGIQVTPKGETQPEAVTGPTSTDGSAQLSAGTIE